jgi:hypothetical protein
MWRTPLERLALLELLVRGTLKRRRAQAAAWDALAELPWTRRTGRRDELGLHEARRGELVALLDRVWPRWSDVLVCLTARGLSPTPDGWSALEDADRAQEVPLLPDRLNRRTAAALVGPHSKATLTERRRSALPGVEATHDGSIRIRPPAGLIVRTTRGSIDLSSVATVLGEVSIPERAFKEGLELHGTVRAALLVENLGAFCDLSSIDGWLYAHVAGWDTATVGVLLERLTHVPVIHFGDLDPNGVRIHHHLRRMRLDLRWFVPPFWEEYLERAPSCEWPEEMDQGDLPQLARQLASCGRWLEQEPIAIDPRTPAALQKMVAGDGPPV